MRGEKTTAKTDLYALAATVYYLLTGEEPVDAWTRERQIKDNRPDPLRDIKVLRPEVDDSFAETNKGKKGIWYQVKAVGSSKGGWIICKDEKECSEDKGLCFSPE